MKEFQEFVRRGTIMKQSPNKSRSRDLSEEAERKEKSLKEIIDKIGLSCGNANDVIEYCYDIIMSLIRAKLYFDGYKSSGVSSHEAEVSYLRNLGFSESEANFMNELRYFRNGIKYYGKRFDEEYAAKVLDFMEKAFSRLKALLVF